MFILCFFKTQTVKSSTGIHTTMLKHGTAHVCDTNVNPLDQELEVMFGVNSSAEFSIWEFSVCTYLSIIASHNPQKEKRCCTLLHVNN